MHLTKFHPADNALAFLLSNLPALTGIGRDHWYKAIKDGKLKAVKQGRRTLVLRQDLEAFLTSLPDAREVNAQQARLGRGAA